MTGGFKMSAGRLSLLAAAGFLLVGGASAQAADLGGDCCADLEERIAELEATTARKGNRKVSLTVYGQVNEAIAYWDDGLEDNVYIYTNDTSRSRIGFKGKAKISDDLYAGYTIEIGIRSNDQGELRHDRPKAWSSSNPGGFDVRHAYWLLGSKKFGEVRMGETSFAHDGITQMQTANIGHFANPDILDTNDSFRIVNSATGGRFASWDDISQVFEPGEGSRGNIVRYITPEFAGFTASAHWGEDDIWGVALEYEGEIGQFEVLAGIGYGEMSLRDEECTETATGSSDCEEYGGSLSVMHKPSGVFVTGAYGMRIDNVRAEILDAAGFAPEDEIWFWHVQAGIEQKWNSLGKTTIFGGYQERDSGMPVNDDGGALLTDDNGDTIVSTSIEMWEAGVNQEISNAAMDLYLHYKHYDADVATTAGPVSTEPFQTVIGGARIKF